MQHKLENHRSFRRPAQLEGLPPGSKVSLVPALQLSPSQGWFWFTVFFWAPAACLLLIHVSSGDYQDLWEDEATDDISRESAAPEPLLPHPANQHKDRVTEVSDPEEPCALQISTITYEETGQPQSPGQQVRLKKSQVSPEGGAGGKVMFSPKGFMLHLRNIAKTGRTGKPAVIATFLQDDYPNFN